MTIRVHLVDGTTVYIEDQPVGSGAEKVAFFTVEHDRVVCFYQAPLNDRWERRRRLDNILGKYNVTTGSQGEYWNRHFCWPCGIVDGDPEIPASFLRNHNLLNPPLAVVTPAYRKNFFFRTKTGAWVEKNGKWFTSEKPRRLVPVEEQGNFLGYLQAGTQMARAVRRLHFMGLAHSDLSNKNVLIDPCGGDACLIDMDALVVPHIAMPVVMGTPGYIAPEVLKGENHPSIETDLHALAVLLYETLLLRHPLRGKRVCSMDSPEEDEKLSMGEGALFIEHPTDHRNLPTQPITFPVEYLGPYLNDLFQCAFVDGLHDPSLRPTADQWEKALYRTFDFLHPSREGDHWWVATESLSQTCHWNQQASGEPIPFIRCLRQDRKSKEKLFIPDIQALKHHEPIQHIIILYQHFQLYKWHTLSYYYPGENDDRTRLGYVVYHQGMWYIVNEGSERWYAEDRFFVAGQSLPIQKGLRLRMGDDPEARMFEFDFLFPAERSE